MHETKIGAWWIREAPKNNFFWTHAGDMISGRWQAVGKIMPPGGMMSCEWWHDHATFHNSLDIVVDVEVDVDIDVDVRLCI